MSAVLTLLFRELAIGMTFSLITVKFIMAYVLFIKYRSNKENKLLLGTSILFVLLAISKIIFAYFDFYLTGFSAILIEQYSIVWKFAGIFQYVGFISFIACAEKVIFKGKTYYVISIILAVLTVIAFALPILTISQLLIGLASLTAILFIPASYLYLAIVSSEDIRRKSLAIFAGFLIYAFGLIILGEPSANILHVLFPVDPLLLRYFAQFLSVFIKFGGMSLFIYGYMRE